MNDFDDFTAKLRIIFGFWGNVGKINYLCRSKYCNYEKNIVDYQLSSCDFLGC